MKTVIVGGVAGGASCAARLRRLDENAEIIILERGEYVSFANCGLPYFVGGEITSKSSLTLQTPQSFLTRFNVEVRTGSEVVSVNANLKTVSVKNAASGELYEESYDKLVLSPGAKPVIPNGLNAFGDRIFTLRTVPDSEKIKRFISERSPKSAVVVGGGFIGMEMAENLVKAGLSVTVVELSDHIVPSIDFDMAADVHSYAEQVGLNIIVNSGVNEIIESDDGITVKLSCSEIATDMVVLSVGVKPDTDFLKGSGIALDERGSILVNDKMQTTAPEVYAVGDAIKVTNFVNGADAFIPLAGPANKQGRIAADNICGIDSVFSGTQGSSVMKLFGMTVASTGINEATARKTGLNYDKAYAYSASHASYYPGATMISIKVLWDKSTLKILGAQAVGSEGVDKRIDVIATALRLGAKVTDLAMLELCYAPPYGSAKDPVNMLGFIAENVTRGLVKQFFWHDVESLPRDGSVTLLDTRTTGEVARGKIDGFINVPLDSLRDRLSEIPVDKPVYVHCHSGLRSYLACRILSGKGYDCYNLSGGFRLYESVVKRKQAVDFPCYNK